MPFATTQFRNLYFDAQKTYRVETAMKLVVKSSVLRLSLTKQDSHYIFRYPMEILEPWLSYWHNNQQP